MVGWLAAVMTAMAGNTIDVRVDGSLMLVTPAAYLDQVEIVGDPVVEVRSTGRPGVVHLVGRQTGVAELRVSRNAGQGLPFTYAVRVSEGVGPQRVRLDVPVGTFIVFNTAKPVEYMATSNDAIADVRAWGTDPSGRPSQLISSTGPGRTDLVMLLEGTDEPLYYEVVSDESSKHDVVELTGSGWVPLGIPADAARPAVSDPRVVQLRKRKGSWSIRARQAGAASVAAWAPGQEEAWVRHFVVAD